MRPGLALLIYISVIFVGGGLGAPWAYWLVQSFADSLPYLAGQPFRRYVNRSMLVLALAGMWPLLRVLGARSARELGLIRPDGQWGRLLGGFSLGFGSLAVLVLLTVGAGVRTFADDVSASRLVQKLASAAGTATGVSVIEEILFRGAIFGAFRKVLNWRVALLVSSAIYSILHFMKRAELAGPVQWYSGLQIVGEMLSGFANWREVIPGFLNLMVAGACLALAYQKSGTLYFSIGLHAGWIFWRRASGVVTEAGSPENLWFWGTGAMTDGWLALLVLGAALFLVGKLRFGEPTTRPPS